MKATSIAFALVPVGILGALHLGYPFHGDQALFVIAAMAIDTGGTLYLDYWDNKQPGIFWFYWLAGKLFGFHEEGVHTLELFWMLAYALVLLVGTRRYFKERMLASLAPLATVGLYYLRASDENLTQVETLVPLPLTVCLLLTSRDFTNARGTMLGHVGFGLAASIVAVFKLILMPIPGAFWLVAAVAAAHRGRRLHHIALAMMLPACAGFALGIGMVAVYFWSRGALDVLYWTSFVYPLKAMRVIPTAPLERLLESVSWFIAPLLVGLPVLAMGVWATMRCRYARFGVLLVVWLVVGFGALLAQKLSWWPEHFILLIAPVGLLTIIGVDEALHLLLPQTSRGRWRVFLMIFLLLMPSFISHVMESWPKLQSIAKDISSANHLGTAYQSDLAPKYNRLRQSVQFLKMPDALPGPIYVFGDPRLLLFSGRSQAIATNGWSWGLWLPEQWENLPKQLALARPAYIYVSKSDAKLLSKRSPETRIWIMSNYKHDHAASYGIWYRKQDHTSLMGFP